MDDQTLLGMGILLGIVGGVALIGAGWAIYDDMQVQARNSVWPIYLAGALTTAGFGLILFAIWVVSGEIKR